jgi:hypothetical protein
MRYLTRRSTFVLATLLLIAVLAAACYAPTAAPEPVAAPAALPPTTAPTVAVKVAPASAVTMTVKPPAAPVTSTAALTVTAAVTKTGAVTAAVTAKATAAVTRTAAVTTSKALTPTVSARVTATATTKAAAPVAPLTAVLLENAAYLSDYLPGGKATLKDGGFEQSTGVGATQKVVTRIVGPVSLGDLNGDGAADAAVILATNTGGTGTFFELHAVLNDNGKPRDAARVDLGDRIFLRSLAIDGTGAIVVRMLTHGPKDPSCCPSEDATWIYKLDGGALTRVSPAAKPGATPAPAAPLTLDQLKNGTYLSEYVPAGRITLKDGKFEQSTGSGATQKVAVVMIEPVAMGDLNGDNAADAAVILATNTGGTGTFYDLHAVLNESGKPKDVAFALLGDRVQIKSLSIQDGAITVSMMTHGPQDPQCCPTQAVTQIYRLQEGKLVLLPSMQAPTITLVAAIPVSRTIAIVTPAEGQVIKSGAGISGTVSVTPFENNLVYRVYAGSNGQVIGSGALTVKGEQTKPGTFAGPIQFTPGKEQVGRLEVLDIDEATGRTFARAAVNVSFGNAMKPFSGKPRTIVIAAPVAGAEVGNLAPLQGTTSITPFENNLVYRVYQGGQLIGSGPILVRGETGAPGTFDNKIEFQAPRPGPASIQVLDQDMATGFVIAEAWVDVVAK